MGCLSQNPGKYTTSIHIRQNRSPTRFGWVTLAAPPARSSSPISAGHCRGPQKFQDLSPANSRRDHTPPLGSQNQSPPSNSAPIDQAPDTTTRYPSLSITLSFGTRVSCVRGPYISNPKFKISSFCHQFATIFQPEPQAGGEGTRIKHTVLTTLGLSSLLLPPVTFVSSFEVRSLPSLCTAH
jgi:hypothetical protein